MGIGKWILGGVCAVGAVVAAPVVLPAAAAAATTAGAAVASSAVGTAVAGAAGAVASSTVGTAVAGGMATVGSAVGTAAGAVGISSVATVATGTAAGATAVGTIATAGAIGAASTGYGAKKMMEAKDIIDNAERKYNAKKSILDKEEKIANEALNYLGKLKLQIWSDFKEFYETIEKIKNCNIIDGNAKEESLVLSKEELDNLRAISFKAIELLNASVGSIGAGALAGIAAYGGTMAIGTASTGAAIAGLSGAAATNATLAALGGGSLAAGGLGMAGGTAVLSGLVAAPALAVGGIFIAFKGNSSIEKALEVEREAEDAIEKLEISIGLVKDIKITADKMYTELTILNNTFKEYLRNLKSIIARNQDFRQFTPKEVSIVENTVLIVKILKNITTTDLLITKGDKQEINRKAINEALNYRNKYLRFNEF